MNKQFARYESYRDSGVEWLGKVPETWGILKANYLFKLINERSLDGAEELLSVSEHHGVKPRSISNVNTFMAESYEGYKLCKKGDLVINSLWAWSRGLGISNYDGIISTAYSVYRPDFVNYNKQYLNYLLRTDKYVAQYLIYSKGIWISRLILSDWAFLRIPILTPPIQEQQKIADFLDKKIAQIDEAIAQKEKMIELLKEYRQVTINNAVTKGLDPNVPMKDSGVEWLGQIPAHWQIKKIKFFGKISSGDAITNSELLEHGNYEVFGGNGLMGMSNKFNVTGDCIIIGRVGALCGNIRLINEPKWITDNALMFKPYLKDYQKFIAIVLNIANLNNLSSSNAQPLITSTKVMNVKFALPPVSEQNQLVEYLDNITSKIEAAIACKQSEIKKLKEYKATLINSAVTGKIKV